MRIPLFTASVAVLALAAGCNRAADEQRKADEARVEANEEITEARREANVKINAARAEANNEVAEATANFNKLREDYRRDTNDRIIALDKEIAEVDSKAMTATGKVKADRDANLAQIRARRETFRSEYNSLETATAATWDSAKERVEKAWNELKKSVDDAD